MFYKKIPVTIQAVKFLSFEEGFSENPEWLVEAIIDHTVNFLTSPNSLTILTLEGNMRASEGDYIVRGIQGEIYACKPEVFEKNYVKV